jgi:hypothetical protein
MPARRLAAAEGGVDPQQEAKDARRSAQLRKTINTEQAP